MKFECFEDIICWQKAKELVISIYNKFKSNKDFSFKDQIQRASLSIMNNIAEGFERQSNKEFVKFLFIAKGSCGEIRSMLYVALELGYLNQKDYNEINNLSIQISKMLSGLIKTLK